MAELKTNALTFSSVDTDKDAAVKRAAVARQIEYGREIGLPWGVSESGFYLLDAGRVFARGRGLLLRERGGRRERERGGQGEGEGGQQGTSDGGMQPGPGTHKSGDTESRSQPGGASR